MSEGERNIEREKKRESKKKSGYDATQRNGWHVSN